MKVLLIESDDAFAHELAAAIEARGLEARITGDGKEAVDLARADRPDCIVLCVELPRMSGYSVCNKLKKDDDLKSIPLIIISAEATQETFESHRKLKTRAEGYLIKPFAPEALVSVMGSIIALPPEPEEAGEVVSLGEEQAPAAPQEDDDLRLLDEAFENIASEGLGAEAEVLVEDAAPVAEPGLDAHAGQEIDRLGEEADAALAALGEEEAPEADLASAAALFDEEPAPPAPEPPPPPRPTLTPRPGSYAAVVAPPPPAAPVHAAAHAAPAHAAPHDGRLQALEAQLAELRAEAEAARAALDDRSGELQALQAEAAAREGALRAREEELEQRLRAHEQELQGHRAGADQAADATRRWAEERATLERDLRTALDRAQAAEGRARSESDRAHQAEDRAHQAEERARTAEGKARSADGRAEAAEARAAAAEAKLAEAEQVTREAEGRASAAEQESASLKLKLEEADQASSLQRAEADQARQRAEALAQELDAAAARAAEHESGLNALRPELDAARQELAAARAEVDGARAEAERTLADLRRRVGELEAQNAKHEERVVKAYQKIKGDEKIREKTRKALAIALQLLEERTGAAPAADVQARRE